MKSIVITLFVAFSFLALSDASAQEVYRTQNGKMYVMAVSADTLLKLTTNDLLVLLDYEDGSFKMKVDKSTFYTGNDSLDYFLSLLKYDIIEFDGKLDVEYINTKGHPPLDFEVEGIVSTNNSVVKGTGHLEHISNTGTFSCVLTLKFILNKSDLGLDLESLKLNDTIEINIVQMVLDKAKD